MAKKTRTFRAILGDQADNFEHLKTKDWTFEVTIGSKARYNAYHNGELVYGRFEDLGQVIRLATQRDQQNHEA